MQNKQKYKRLQKMKKNNKRKTEGDYLIIKHVHNGNITCAYYENEKTFIKQCRKPEFRDVLLNAKYVIVLENNGNKAINPNQFLGGY